MEFVYNYMKDNILRHRLNTLTQKTFDLDFEDWVKGGYFEGDYLPYSFMENEKILSNVSVNRMNFLQNGVHKNYIQIGTVMTEEAYRRQGLARKLMEHILAEYEGKCDGIYLFANLNALDFYRKIGLQEGLQYQYTLKKEYFGKGEKGTPFRKVDAQDKQIRMKYMNAVKNSAIHSSFEQINKYGLQMFYTADLCNVYYAEDLDCFAVMEQQGDELVLQSVIRKNPVSMAEVIACIDLEYNRLMLGFSPCRKDAFLFDASVYDGGEDYRFFYLGSELESIEKEKLFFPLLSHA